MVPSDIMNARPQEGDFQVCSSSNPSDSVSEVSVYFSNKELSSTSGRQPRQQQ